MIALLFVALHSAVPAQSRLRATAAGNFLKDPGGIRLGTLVVGQTYATGRSASGHIETTVEGWIFARSTEATSRDGFDLTVIAGGGENLRVAPGGALVARLQEGTLLTRVETRGGWYRVRRGGWVPVGALAARQIVAQSAPPAAAPPPDTSPARPAAPRTDSGAAALPVSGSDAPPDPRVAGIASLRDGAKLALTPDGAAIARLATATDVQVLGRSGGWVRVRLEGWVPVADVAAEVPQSPRVSAAMLQADPQRFLGQTVIWRLQFLAVQTADALRPEIPAGETYILARGPLPESGFTYLMVTRAQADEFRRLAPLDQVTVEATVRASRTKYLPTPVLELVRMVR